MPPDPLDRLARHRVLSLESYRQDGRAVRTPLLFVENEGVLYMRTPAATAKVRRVRRNSRVRVAPCDLRGRVRGDWLDGVATVAPAGDLPWVNSLARRRHGLLKWLIDLRNRLLRREFVVIAVRLHNWAIQDSVSELRLDHGATNRLPSG